MKFLIKKQEIFLRNISLTAAFTTHALLLITVTLTYLACSMLCHDVFRNTNLKHEHIVMYLHFHANLHTADSTRIINTSVKFPALHIKFPSLHTKGTCSNLQLPCVTVQQSCNIGHQGHTIRDTPSGTHHQGHTTALAQKKIASSIYDSTYAWRDNILTLKTCTGTYRNKW
jgi:hypothetical protein